MAEARDARLNAVGVSLSATFWQAISFAVLILLFVSSAVERTRFRSIIMGCQMAVLGAFIGFVFIMDQPFKGHSAVDPQVIVQTIAIIEARKGGYERAFAEPWLHGATPGQHRIAALSGTTA